MDEKEQEFCNRRTQHHRSFSYGIAGLHLAYLLSHHLELLEIRSFLPRDMREDNHEHRDGQILGTPPNAGPQKMEQTQRSDIECVPKETRDHR